MRSAGFDLWRAIDAEGGAPSNSDWRRGFNAGLEAASKHVERLGYHEGDIVQPKATVDALVAAVLDLLESLQEILLQYREANGDLDDGENCPEIDFHEYLELVAKARAAIARAAIARAKGEA